MLSQHYRSTAVVLVFIWGKFVAEAHLLKVLKVHQVAFYHGLNSLIIRRFQSISRQRQGAIAVYLDVWHKDVFTFLDLRLNNGDERLRAHDIFTGLCLPDIFMETVEARGEWHLFDPHEYERLWATH